MAPPKDDIIDHILWAQRLAPTLAFIDSEYHNYLPHLEKLNELLDFLADNKCLTCIEEVRREYDLTEDIIVSSIEAEYIHSIKYEQYKRILIHIDKYIARLKEEQQPDDITQKINMICDLLSSEGLLSKGCADSISLLIHPKGVVDKMINWVDEQWKLHVIIEFLNELGLLFLKGYEIAYYAKKNFHFKNHIIDISKFNDSVCKSKNHKITGKYPTFMNDLDTVRKKYMTYLSK